MWTSAEFTVAVARWPVTMRENNRLSGGKPGSRRSRWLGHFHWKCHPSRGIIPSSCATSRSVGHGVALPVTRSTGAMKLSETPTVQARVAPCRHASPVQFAERNVSMDFSCGGRQDVFFSRGAPPSHVLNGESSITWFQVGTTPEGESISQAFHCRISKFNPLYCGKQTRRFRSLRVRSGLSRQQSIMEVVEKSVGGFCARKFERNTS